MLPSPTDLTYFAEVAKQSNMSHAAKLLGITQPSLTLAIQRLEEAVGTALVIRHKRGVNLTKAGEALLLHTTQLLDQWQRIKTNTLSSADEVQGCVTIGCHPSLALHALPRFLPGLVKEYPLLNIELVHDISRRVTDEVIQLRVDMAIAVNPERHQDLVITPLDEDKITLWHRTEDDARQQLATGDAVIICDPQLAQIQSILKQMKQSGMHYKRLLASSSLEVIAKLTANGAGIGILPGNVACRYQLAEIPEAPAYEDEICLVYRGENRDVRTLQTIVSAIKHSFSNKIGLTSLPEAKSPLE